MTVLEFMQRVFTPQSGMVNWALMAVAALAGAFFLFMLSQAPPAMRRRIVALVTFVAGGFYVVEFLIPADDTVPGLGRAFKNPLTPWIGPVGSGIQVVGAFAIFLGVVNLTMMHGRNAAKRAAGWGNSAVLLVALYLTFAVGMWKQYWPDFPSASTIAFPRTGRNLTMAQTAWDLVFNGILNPLDATMFSLLAFFITSAAFRAFRMRSLEATLLMITAFVVMFGMVPFGQGVTGWAVDSIASATGWSADGLLDSFRAQTMRNWIMQVINAPVQRAIILGYMMGMVAMSLRILLNLEKGSYFEST